MDYEGLLAEVKRLQQDLIRVQRDLLAERSRCGMLRRQLGIATAMARAMERRQRPDGPQGEDDGRAARLAADRARAANKYVFEDDDDSVVAFDEYFSTPDPHLEKLRGFLLD